MVAGIELRASIAYYPGLSPARGRFFAVAGGDCEVEIARRADRDLALAWSEPDPEWVFSRLFFEAHAELGDPRYGLPTFRTGSTSPDPRQSRRRPSSTTSPGATMPVRREAVERFEAGSEGLRADIEARRAQHRDESLSLRRRIYSVLLVLEDQQTMIAVADQVGLPWRCFEDNKGAPMSAGRQQRRRPCSSNGRSG